MVCNHYWYYTCYYYVRLCSAAGLHLSSGVTVIFYSQSVITNISGQSSVTQLIFGKLSEGHGIFQHSPDKKLKYWAVGVFAAHWLPSSGWSLWLQSQHVYIMFTISVFFNLSGSRKKPSQSRWVHWSISRMTCRSLWTTQTLMRPKRYEVGLSFN